MSDNIFSVSCDIICPDGTLGAMGAQDQFCNDINLSQIQSLIWWHPTLGTPIDNWGVGLSALDFSIDNTDAFDVAQKQVFGIGSVGEPTENEIELGSFQKQKLPSVYPISFKLYTFTAATYDYLRSVQCGQIKPLIAYTTEGGYIYGKDGGITATKWSVEFMQPEGENAVEYFQFNIEFKAKNAPDRLINPL
tara:strand:- start:271 stop:846 length:576 start_codon:yes stop_codon:yes gene_type:complete